MVSNAVPSIRVYNALDVAASGQAASLGLVEDDRLITPLDSKEIPILGGGSLKSYGTVTLLAERRLRLNLKLSSTLAIITTLRQAITFVYCRKPSLKLQLGMNSIVRMKKLHSTLK